MAEPLYTADEMRAAEERYPGFPESAGELRERAGGFVAAQVRARYIAAHRVTVVCGAGSNGGDGRIAAEVLREEEFEVHVVDESGGWLGEPDVVVDALFGTGFHGEPRPDAVRLIEAMNDAGVPVVAVDVPSGVNASTGEVAGIAVRADTTVTFHGVKMGLAVAPGRFHAGTVTVADIGLEPGETRAQLVGRELLALVPRRSPGDNKYSSGSVVVVGGSAGLTGAPCLTAEAAFRADAGYVAVACARSALPVFEQRLLEAVKRPCPDDDEGRLTEEAAAIVLELAEKAGAVALGPGLGRSDGTKALVRRLLAELNGPLVIDADALHELEPFSRAAPTVLTPHEGELGRLLGEPSEWVAAHRLEAANRAVERFGCTILLKGSETIVASPGEGMLVTSLSVPALATAGTGDVLTGILAAFLSKGMDARTAAAAAAIAQGTAASLIPEQAGLIASDVVSALPRALDAPV